MTVKELLGYARAIWGPRGKTVTSLSQGVIIPMGVVYGDICRWEREQVLASRPPIEVLEKELGNMIFSTIRWCSDLGLDPDKCIERAIECQKQFVKTRPRKLMNRP